MSGGISALWRTSLCGVVMALTVFSTGCAIDASGDAGDDEEQAQSELVNVDSITTLGTDKRPEPGGGLQNPTTGPLSPTAKIDEVAEPEPEPWHPRSRSASSDSDKLTVNMRSDSSGDHK